MLTNLIPNTDPEESPGRAGLEAAVLDLGLLGEVLGGLDGSLHPLHGEEGGEVGGVGGDHDEGEEPPHPGHHPGGDCPAIYCSTLKGKVELRPDLLGRDITALLHERADGEPHGVTERELVDQHLRLVIAGVRVVPLVRTESETGIRS